MVVLLEEVRVEPQRPIISDRLSRVPEPERPAAAWADSIHHGIHGTRRDLPPGTAKRPFVRGNWLSRKD
jgi:hypothetical protein